MQPVDNAVLMLQIPDAGGCVSLFMAKMDVRATVPYSRRATRVPSGEMHLGSFGLLHCKGKSPRTELVQQRPKSQRDVKTARSGEFLQTEIGDSRH